MYIIYAIIICLVLYSSYKYITKNEIEYISIFLSILMTIIVLNMNTYKKSISINEVQDLIKNAQQ